MTTTKEQSLGTVYLLKRAELAVRSCVEAALAPFRLTPTQFLLLLRLEDSGGMSSAELARAAGVRPQSIVDLIGPLEREGLDQAAGSTRASAHSARHVDHRGQAVARACEARGDAAR